MRYGFFVRFFHPKALFVILMSMVFLSDLSAQAFTTWNARIASIFERITKPQEGSGYISAPVHDWITEVLKQKYQFKESAYQKIIWGMAEQDIPDTQAFLTSENHFDDNKINESLMLIEQRKAQVDQLLPYVAQDAVKRDTFYRTYGYVLHAMQDFYSHSNYIELNFKDRPQIKNPNELQLINWLNMPQGIRTGYFYWSGLSDWEKFSTLPTCIAGLKSNPEFRNVPFRDKSEYCSFMNCSAATQAALYINNGWVNDPKEYKSFNDAINNAVGSKAELHYYLNKDDWGTPMGSQVPSGSQNTLYDFARYLAEQETLRQWQEIESKIKTMFGSQADKVLLAIKTDTTQTISNSSTSTVNAQWKISKNNLMPNEAFQVSGPMLTTSSRFLVIVPSITKHTWDATLSADIKDSAFKPGDTEKTMTAPGHAGQYDLRVYRYLNEEQAALPFTVKAATTTPTPTNQQPPHQQRMWRLSNNRLREHAPYSIQFTPVTGSQESYPVALTGVGTPHINFLQIEPFSARYIKQLTFQNGISVKLYAPSPAGLYQARIYDPRTQEELAMLPMEIVPAAQSSQSPAQDTHNPPTQPMPPSATSTTDNNMSSQRQLPPLGDCGVAGYESAITGRDFAGYWKTTNGIMRLIRVGPNVLEGPSSASSYYKGTQNGTLFTGRFADDTGEYHPGHFNITMTEANRCLKGEFIYDDDGGVNPILGYRIHKPSTPYSEMYELGNNTEDLKHIVGGIVPFGAIDGPDDFLGAPQQNAPRQANQNQANALPSASLGIDKPIYTPGETMRVSFTAAPNFTPNAWLGIVPVHFHHGNPETAEADNLGMETINGRLQGVVNFTAPDEIGDYEVRLYNFNNGPQGQEIGYIRFGVR